MSGCQYKVPMTGDEVLSLLNKIKELGNATTEKGGLMSACDKAKLDSINIHCNTTEFWNRQVGYIPKYGEIIIYSDYKTAVIDGKTTYIPGIKIGSGNGYVQDLVFVNGGSSAEVDNELLFAHIADAIVHITQAERDYWNNKLNVTDAQEVVGESLIFNRN